MRQAAAIPRPTRTGRPFCRQSAQHPAVFLQAHCHLSARFLRCRLALSPGNHRLLALLSPVGRNLFCGLQPCRRDRVGAVAMPGP